MSKKRHSTILINTSELKNKVLIDVRSKPMIERFYKFTVLMLLTNESVLRVSRHYMHFKNSIDIHFDVKN